MTQTPNLPADAAKPQRSREGLLASGTGLIGIKVLNAALGFATVVVFARLLPPDSYGLYLLVLTIAQFLALPLQMGIPVLLTREISVARAKDDQAALAGIRIWTRKIISWGTIILGGLVIGLYAVVVAAGWPILQSFDWAIVLLIVALIPVISEMKRVMGQLNGYHKPAQSRVPDGVIRPTLLLLAGGAGLWLGWFLETGLVAVYLGSAALAALGGWSLLRRAEAVDPPYGGPAEIRAAAWWQSLKPLTLFAAAGSINTYADVLMLGALDSTEAVAFYRVASQIVALALLAQVAVNAVLSPRLAALHATDGHDRMQALAVRGSRIAFAATLVFAGLLAIVGEAGFVRLFGADYAMIYPLAMVLSVGTALNAVFGGTTMLLNMTNREKSSATYALSAALANIALNLALIPLLGAMGAALATVITMTAMHALAWRRLRLDLGLRTDAFARIQS